MIHDNRKPFTPKRLQNVLQSTYVFPDSKRRSKLMVVRDCVIEIEEWTEKLKSRKSIVEAVLQLLDKNARKRGGLVGA